MASSRRCGRASASLAPRRNERGNMEFDLQAIDRRIGQLTKTDDEALGRIVGIAAVVALLPGTGAVTVPAAKAVIAELMQYVVGAGPRWRTSPSGRPMS